MGLTLDQQIMEGNSANGVTGIKHTAGVQTVSMGADGGAISDLDPFADALNMLELANARGTAIVMHPRTWGEVRKLKDAQGRPLVNTGTGDTPPSIYSVPVLLSTQLSTAETQGTANDGSSVYVMQADQVLLVRRRDVSVELDRSRLFHQDQSEFRARLRADVLLSARS